MRLRFAALILLAVSPSAAEGEPVPPSSTMTVKNDSKEGGKARLIVDFDGTRVFAYEEWGAEEEHPRWEAGISTDWVTVGPLQLYGAAREVGSPLDYSAGSSVYRETARVDLDTSLDRSIRSGFWVHHPDRTFGAGVYRDRAGRNHSLLALATPNRDGLIVDIAASQVRLRPGSTGDTWVMTEPAHGGGLFTHGAARLGYRGPWGLGLTSFGGSLADAVRPGGYATGVGQFVSGAVDLAALAGASFDYVQTDGTILEKAAKGEAVVGLRLFRGLRCEVGGSRTEYHESGEYDASSPNVGRLWAGLRIERETWKLGFETSATKDSRFAGQTALTRRFEVDGRLELGHMRLEQSLLLNLENDGHALTSRTDWEIQAGWFTLELGCDFVFDDEIEVAGLVGLGFRRRDSRINVRLSLEPGKLDDDREFRLELSLWTQTSSSRGQSPTTKTSRSNR